LDDLIDADALEGVDAAFDVLMDDLEDKNIETWEQITEDTLKAIDDQEKAVKELADAFRQLGDGLSELGVEINLDSISDGIANIFEAFNDDDLGDFDKALVVINESLAAFGDISQQVTEQRLENLKEQLDQGIISEKEYAKQKAEIQTKQAKTQKAEAIFGAIVGTAAAIVQALNSPPPASFVFAALAGAIGAAQISFIASQPIPKFAKGTEFVKGEGHPDGIDTVPAYLTKGERVITADKNKKYWDILNAVHQDRPDNIITAIAKMGIPVQFKTTHEELYKPMTAMHALAEGTPLKDMDWDPLLRSNEMGRRSAGKKLDKIYMEMVRLNSGITRRMTRA